MSSPSPVMARKMIKRMFHNRWSGWGWRQETRLDREGDYGSRSGAVVHVPERHARVLALLCLPRDGPHREKQGAGNVEVVDPALVERQQLTPHRPQRHPFAGDVDDRRLLTRRHTT